MPGGVRAVAGQDGRLLLAGARVRGLRAADAGNRQIVGSGIGANYETMVQKWLADDRHWTHFLTVEDDMMFPADALHRLASHRVPIDRTIQLGIHDTRDIFPIKNNLHLGISYLSQLIKEFGSYAHAIAAYSAGEETVRKWKLNGHYKAIDEFIEDIPYMETRNYVKRVLTSFFEYNRLFSAPEESTEGPHEKL